MGFARTLARGLNRGIVLDGDTLTDELGGTERLRAFGGGLTKAGPAVDHDRALRIVAINAAVRLKVNATRSIPMGVYQVGTDGIKDYEAGSKARVYELVHEAPNEEQAADEFWALIAQHLAHRRNAFVFKDKFAGGPRDGLLRGLWVIDPRRVTVKREKGEKVFEISRRMDGGDLDPVTMRADQIVHVKSGLTAPNGLVALSPIDQCRETLGVTIASQQYLANHLGRGANFPGYLYNDDPEHAEVTEDAAIEIEERLIGPGRGAGGVHQVPVFNSKLKFERMGMTLADQDFMDLLGWGLAECALLMDVPPTLLNAPIRGSSLTYRTTREEDQRFLKYGISPDLTAVESALRVDADLFKGSLYVPEFRREAHLSMDTIARYQAHALAINARWKTPNDVRRIENMKPLEGGDELLRAGQKPDDQTRALLKMLEEFDGAPNGNGNTPAHN